MERSSESVWRLERQSRDALVLTLETPRGWLWTAEWLVLPVAKRVIRLQDGVDLPRALVDHRAPCVPPEALNRVLVGVAIRPVDLDSVVRRFQRGITAVPLHQRCLARVADAPVLQLSGLHG